MAYASLRSAAAVAAFAAVGVLGGTWLGCGSTGPAAGSASMDSSAPAAGGNSLSGSFAFPVRDAVLDTLEAQRNCGYAGVLPDGTYGTFEVLLSDVPGLCSDGGSLGANVTSAHVLTIQIAGPTYATSRVGPDAGTPLSIALGDHAIDYEGVTDEDLCMLDRSGSSALLEVYDFVADAGGDPTAAVASSGTVTLTALAPGHAAGTFDVKVAPVSASGIDAQHPVALSGSFDATSCPGTMP